MDAKTALKLNIVELRKKFNLSQAELAAKLDTTQKTISEIETGKVWADYKMIQKFAKFFEVEESDLFTDPKMLESLKYLMGRK